MRYALVRLLVATLVWCWLAAVCTAAQPIRVAIVPFRINAAEDYSFLREGIGDMLASRLAWEGKVEVIEKQRVREAMASFRGPVDEAAARKIGTALEADYVLFGSLTIFGSSVSIDAKMVPLTTGKEAVSLYTQTKGMDEVIPRINDFAQEVNAKIFGRAPVAAAAAPKPQFTREHPEKLLQSPAGGTAVLPQEAGGSFEIIQPASGAAAPRDLIRSQTLNFPINGMDVGDVDGDGRPEVVLLSRFKQVRVYTWDQGRLLQRAAFEGQAFDRYVWVCAFDADRDGKAEIYVSNLRKDILSSLVLAWNGDRLVPVAEDLRWYFNRGRIPGRGEVLLGQKKKLGEIFDPGVFVLQAAGSEYQPLEGLGLPPKANLFNFVQADLDGDGGPETLILGDGDRLYVYDAGGRRLWKSRDYYGATANLVPGPGALGPVEIRPATIEDEVKRYYIPSQLLAVDFDRDRRAEILANRNVSFAGQLLMKYRNFSDARIESLGWTGYGLQTLWQTKPLQGMVVSYQLADIDGDQQDEIVAAVVLDKELLEKSKSVVVVYELDEIRAAMSKSQSGQ